MNNRQEEINEMRRKLSLWVAPVIMGTILPVHAQTSFIKTPPNDPPVDPPVDPECVENCDPEEPPVDPPVCDGEWTKSSFVFTDDFTVCNHGDGASVCLIRYDINIDTNLTGQPNYEPYSSGSMAPLGVSGCRDMSQYLPAGTYRYEILVYQDEGHPGLGYLASRGTK